MEEFEVDDDYDNDWSVECEKKGMEIDIKGVILTGWVLAAAAFIMNQRSQNWPTMVEFSDLF